jgi:hypothetical protein
MTRTHDHCRPVGEAEAVGVDIGDEDAVARRTRQRVDLTVDHRVELLLVSGTQPQAVTWRGNGGLTGVNRPSPLTSNAARTRTATLRSSTR